VAGRPAYIDLRGSQLLGTRLLTKDLAFRQDEREAFGLRALLPDLRPAPFDPAVLREWAAWDLEHGLLKRPLDVNEAFRLSG